jgi:hypothetical protein
MNWTPETTEKLKALKILKMSDAQIAKEIGCDTRAVSHKWYTLGSIGRKPASPEQSAPQPVQETEGAPPLGLDKPVANTAIPVVAKPIELPVPEIGGYLPLEVINTGDWVQAGLIADTHLCCREERLAELHNQYDLFADEGISNVFLAGNIVDGYISKINGASVFTSTIDGQCQYVIDNFPRRAGITTYFITGDDHEGWWQKEGFNFGGYLQYLAHDQGRTDLRYIGHVEADVAFKHSNGTKTMMKVQHPGGGSAYARSYTGQKQVESFEGGEKPDILVQGHYHVSNYMNERNVHVISLPGFQDQTIFARKKKLRMEIGGSILAFKVFPDSGAITRCRVEFNRYFTRGFYKHYLRSDAKILKGELEIPA